MKMSAPTAPSRSRHGWRARLTAGACLLTVTTTACMQYDEADRGSAPVESARSGAVVPATAAPLAAPTPLPASEMRRVAYVVAAGAKGNVRLDLLAGATANYAAAHPGLTQAQYAVAISTMWGLLNGITDRPDDTEGYQHLIIEHLFERLVTPSLGASREADALRAQARTYLNAMRSNADNLRRVSPLAGLDDQLAASETFRRDSWERLLDRTGASPALAGAVNAASGAFVTVLGIRTSDSARAILDIYRLEPLRTYFLANVQADGSVSFDRATIQQMVADASATVQQQTRLFASNLVSINTAEQTYLEQVKDFPLDYMGGGPLPPPPPPPSPSALEQAITSAESAQSSLEGTLKDVKSGVSGTLKWAAKLASWSNDPEFAKDIETFSNAASTLLSGVAAAAKSAIDDAKSVVDTLHLGSTAFKVLGSAFFAGGLVATALEVMKLFGDSGPTIDQQILAAVKALSEQVRQLRQDMDERFDRVDHKLNLIFDALMEQFDHINFQLGTISADVGLVKQALFAVQSELSRLDRNIYAYLNALGRRDLINEINGSLNYAALVSQPMSFDHFFAAQNIFYSWANNHALDPLEAGSPERSYDDGHLASEMASLPLSSNINYLSELARRRLGVTLASEFLVNPNTWQIAAESYAELFEEWPELVAQLNTAEAAVKLGNIVNRGQAAANALDKAASAPLFAAVAANYGASLDALGAEIAHFTSDFEAAPVQRLKGLHLWSQPTDLPTTSLVSQTQELRLCSGVAFSPGRATIPFAFAQITGTYAEIAPFLNGNNLAQGNSAESLGALSACVRGYWSGRVLNQTPLGVEYEYELIVDVPLTYKPAGVSTGTVLQSLRVPTGLKRNRFVRPSEHNWDPSVTWPPDKEIGGQWPTNGQSAASYARSTRYGSAPASLIAQTKAAVTTQLRVLERRYYGAVANELAGSVGSIQAAAAKLTSWKKIWAAYATFGLPLLVANNDELRELLFGIRSVLSGTDEADGDGQPNDFADVYRFYSVQEAQPPVDILPELMQVGHERADALAAALAAAAQHIVETGVPQGHELLGRTLLRLRLLQAPAPTP